VLKVEEDRIELVSVDHPELGDYIKTYVQQFNGMVETFRWMEPHLSREQRGVWLRTIAALRTICRALDAGFEPTQPPNWPHGPLTSFLGVIPGAVRERLDVAIPIFTPSGIEVYDPNESHFIRLRAKDPLVAGRVTLEGRNFFFEVGRWDIPQDLKFLESMPQRERQTTGNLGEVSRALQRVIGAARSKWVDRYAVAVTSSRWETNWLRGMGFQPQTTSATTSTITAP